MKTKEKSRESLENKFSRLAEKWKEETWFHSSIRHICSNPAYQEIIQMGKSVIPLILRDIDNNWGYFSLLREITGVNRVPDEYRGQMDKMRDCWLDWGREQSYI